VEALKRLSLQIIHPPWPPSHLLQVASYFHGGRLAGDELLSMPSVARSVDPYPGSDALWPPQLGGAAHLEWVARGRPPWPRSSSSSLSRRLPAEPRAYGPPHHLATRATWPTSQRRQPPWPPWGRRDRGRRHGRHGAIPTSGATSSSCLWPPAMTTSASSSTGRMWWCCPASGSPLRWPSLGTTPLATCKESFGVPT
jgi:hypothetical protein